MVNGIKLSHFENFWQTNISLLLFYNMQFIKWLSKVTYCTICITYIMKSFNINNANPSFQSMQRKISNRTFQQMWAPIHQLLICIFLFPWQAHPQDGQLHFGVLKRISPQTRLLPPPDSEMSTESIWCISERFKNLFINEK